MKNRLCFCASMLPVLMWAGVASAQIEEIVVTAEFREAGVQDTPLAVTAVSSEMIEARNQTNIFEVGAQAPNVTLAPANIEGGPAMLAFIRGVGQTDFNYAVEPGVGFYVDEIYFPTLTGTLIDLLDLERVEILRGPQGTLAGRNSIGGAIKLFSRLPGEDGGRVEATAGSYGRIDIGGAMDFTVLEDRLYARVAGVSKSQDGHVERLDYQCTHPGSGVPTSLTGDLPDCKLGTEGGRKSAAGRLSLRWLAADNLEINLAYDISNEDSESGAGTLLRVNEELSRVNGYGAGTFIRSTIDGTPIYYDNRFVPYGDYRGDPAINDPYVNYANYLDANTPTATRPYSPATVPPVSKLDQSGISATIDWQINDLLSLKSITAYRKYDADWAYDGDLSPVHSELLFQRLEHDQFSQELRLSGSAFGDLLNYTLGGFYFEQDGTLEASVNLYYAQLNFIHGPDPTPSDAKALFAHTVWRLGENANLTLGARYSEDEKDYVYFRRNPDGTAPVPCAAPPPFILANPANCALFGFSNETGHFEDERMDWRAALDYSVTDDLMVYFQASTGYKAGGINPRPFFTVQIEAVNPEEIISYEAGFKSYLLERRVRLNGALFFNDYTDIQLQQTECELPFPPFFGGPCLQPGNAGDAEVLGFELEGLVELDNGWMLDASLSYLDFEYTRVAENVAVTEDMTSPYTPDLKYSLGVQYAFDMGGNSVVSRLDLSYQDDVYAHAINSENNRIEGYTLLNGRITWQSASKNWELSALVNNITDKLYYHSIFDQFLTTGSIAAKPALPRTWGVTVKRSFGSPD